MSTPTTFEDSEPTKPVEPFASKTIVLAHKIDRLALTALEALRTGHPQSVAIASQALLEITHLASEVAR